MPAIALLPLLLAAACAGRGTLPRPAPNPTASSMEQAAPVAVSTQPLPALAAAPASSEAALKDLLGRIESAYKQGEYAKGLALVKEVLQMNRTDLSSFDRIGSTYFVLGRYGEALTVWERGLAEEKDPARRKELASSVALARASLGLEPPAAPSPGTRPASAPSPKPKAPADPAASAKLYDKGVEHYARGEYLQASSLFMRALDLDAGNAQARKALERLKLKPEGR